MAIIGWYYLHENRQLIYKRELGDTAADIRESDFAHGLWPMDPQDRAGAWRILIEGGAAGALPARVAELAHTWGCTDEDALVYAERVRSLDRGQALVVSPGWLKFEGVVRVRMRETFDSSATPKPGERPKIAKGEGAKPDLASIRERMAATLDSRTEDLLK